MKNVLLIGASGGIGQALHAALEAKGRVVTALSRSRHGLDLTRESSIEEHLGKLDQRFDAVLLVTGGLEIDGVPPEKSLKALSAQNMVNHFTLNAMGPGLVLRHAGRLLPRKSPCVFAALSARVGSIGDNRLGGWISYRAAKAALNQIVHTAAIELARTHPQSVCVALHPGTVETALTQKYAGGYDTVTPDVAAENLLGVLDGLGPEDTGGFFDWAGKQVPW